MVPVECYFVLSALLFAIGVFGFVTRRNLIAMLISIELVLNSVDINFAAFNRLLFPGQLEGFFFSLFFFLLCYIHSLFSLFRWRYFVCIINSFNKNTFLFLIST